MASGIFITGVKVVNKALEKRYMKAKDETYQGLILGANLIFREAQKHVPWDLGNLSGSGYVRRTRQGLKPTVEIGYESNYALAVHENVGANFQRPGATAKWLENAVNEKREEALDLARRAVEKAINAGS